MKLVWTPEAEQDRIDIWDYITADNQQAAIKMDELFSESVKRLIQHPNMGRSGQIPGTRELIPHEHYRIVYETNEDTIWILALVHTSKKWPRIR